MRFVFFLLTILLFLGGSGALATEIPTQRDWMLELVDGLGWSFGLPDEPEDADYLSILDGNRKFRLEAEERKAATDMVSIKRHRTFGDYSAQGWISGLSTATEANMEFQLPLGGDYRLSAALRLPGHEILVDGSTFAGDGKERFEKVDLGRAELAAGKKKITLRIPPNGGFDYLEFEAPNYRPIAPLGGWNLDRPLSFEDMAVTAAKALELESLLPPDGGEILFEAESSAERSSPMVTADHHLGSPSGGEWVRAGRQPAEFALRFDLPSGGVYSLFLRGKGSPTVATLNGRLRLRLEFAPYLQTLPLGTFALEGGKNELNLEFPPRGGADVLRLESRSSKGADYRRLLGLPVEGAPSAARVNELIALLAALAPRR